MDRARPCGALRQIVLARRVRTTLEYDRNAVVIQIKEVRGRSDAVAVSHALLPVYRHLRSTFRHALLVLILSISPSETWVLLAAARRTVHAMHSSDVRADSFGSSA